MDNFELRAEYVNSETATDPITAKTPWKQALGDIPFHIDYFNGTLYEGIKATAEKYPNQIAFDFMGRPTTYRKMLTEIQRCARSFRTLGIRDRGILEVGKAADITIFDWNTVAQTGDYMNPYSRPRGIEKVIVAGQVIVEDGRITDARPGQILRHGR